MMTSTRMLMLALAAASSSLAAPARAETLEQAIAYAYDANPGLQSQRAAMRALDESYPQARAAFGPTINVAAGLGAERNDQTVIPNNPLSAAQTSFAKTNSNALTIQQTLYSGGRLHDRLTVALAQILSGRQTLRRFEIDMLQRVIVAYVSVRRDERILSISNDTVTALEKQLSDTQAKFAVHEVTMTDLSQAKARLAQARAQATSAYEQLAISRSQYLQVVGQNPGHLEPPPPLEDLPQTIDQALDAAELNNPQLVAAEYTELGSRATLAEARAGRLPTVSVQFGMNHQPFVPYQQAPYDNTKSAIVTINQPLFASGAIESQIRQAVEENNRDRLAIDDTRLTVIQQVDQAWEQVANDRKVMTSLAEEMNADNTAYYGVRQEEKFALRTTLDILNAQSELTSAELSLARIQAEEYAGRAQLLAAMGLLDIRRLAPNVRVYDPADNFRAVRNKGATPLEAPGRALDAIAGPPIGRPRPASIGEIRPEGSPMTPPPPDIPMISIFSTANREPDSTPTPATAPTTK